MGGSTARVKGFVGRSQLGPGALRRQLQQRSVYASMHFEKRARDRTSGNEAVFGTMLGSGYKFVLDEDTSFRRQLGALASGCSGMSASVLYTWFTTIIWEDGDRRKGGSLEAVYATVKSKSAL